MEKNLLVFTNSIEYEMSHNEEVKQLLAGYQLKHKVYESSETTFYLIENDDEMDIRVLKIMDKSKVFTIDRDMILSISHPNIAKVYDLCETNKRIYKIREYVSGKTLEEYVMERISLEEHTVRSIGIKLCKIFTYLHTIKPNPIIYRDLKPSNIILTESGEIMLIDLISCRRFKDTAKDDTYNIGTRGYAAPEQYGFGQTNEFTDIYNLGVTLHYLLTREIVITDQFILKPISTYRTDVSSELIKVIEKCTKFDPKKRFKKIDQVLKALEIRAKNKNYIVGLSTICLGFLMIISVMFIRNDQLEKDMASFKDSISTPIGNDNATSETLIDDLENSNVLDMGEENSYMSRKNAANKEISSLELEENNLSSDPISNDNADDNLVTDNLRTSIAIDATTDNVATTELVTERLISEVPTEEKVLASTDEVTVAVDLTTTQLVPANLSISPVVVVDFEAAWKPISYQDGDISGTLVQNITMERFEDSDFIYLKINYVATKAGTVYLFLENDYPGLKKGFSKLTHMGDNQIVLQFEKQKFIELVNGITDSNIQSMAIRLVGDDDDIHFITFNDLLGY